MTDDKQTLPAPEAEAPQGSTPAAPAPTDIEDINALPKWAQDNIRDLRREAADRRVAAKKAEEARAAEEAARLAEQGNYKALYEKTSAETAALKAQAEAAQAYRDAIASTVEARVKALPAQYRTLVPAFDDPLKTLAWLDANASVFAAPRAPDMDAGASGDKTTQLTAEEARIAQRMGINPAELAKFKSAQGKR